MKWSIWAKIDELLTMYKIKPILAVIPDNKDPTFFIEKRKSSFWEYVKEKQKQGWSIGLHGYQHIYVTKNPGILGINPFSEFAGLPEEEQEAKISKAIAIFRANGIKPDLWIAPAHSFDEITLKVLKKYGITIISDGFSLYPYIDDNGMLWVPQQLWWFQKMPCGLFTVLFHHNLWTEQELQAFENALKKYRRQIVSLSDVIRQYSSRRKGLVDHVFECFWRLQLSIGRRIFSR